MRRRGERDVIVCEAAGGLAIPVELLAGHDHPVWFEAAERDPMYTHPGARQPDILSHVYHHAAALREFVATAGPPLAAGDGLNPHVWYYCVVEAVPELRRRGLDSDRAVDLAGLHR